VSADDDYQAGTAYALWLACFCGLFGIHRFYLGKPVTGLLYLFTFGLFGIGQVLDLVRMRSMVEEKNLALMERRQRLLGHMPQRALPAMPAAPARDPQEELRQALTRAAAERGGTLSVTQGVLATGKDFKDVEAALDTMVRSGYVDITNDGDSGIVVYSFGELVPRAKSS
jgi:hypothetical protein